MDRPSRIFTLLLLTAFLADSASAQLSERFAAMNQPVPPVRIAGNLYYVGANSVAAYLITTPEGHVLIDGGFEETVPLIRKSVEALGFRLEDVEILLNSHAHFDHAGGLAALKEATGAKLLASRQEAPLLERGGLDDDLLGDEAPFPPVAVDRLLEPGDTVELGGVVLTALVTPGHTRGCTSWSFEVAEGERTYRAVSICSLSVLDGMRFRSEPTYPGIEEDFRRSYEILEATPCDLFLASHAGFFDLEGKRARRAQGGENPFVDPQGYRAYIDRARKQLEKALAKEAEEAERANLRPEEPP